MNEYLPAHQHTGACGHTPPAPAPTCTHAHHPAPHSDAGKWLSIGVGGSLLVITLAIGMVAFALGAVALTVCLLVLRSTISGLTSKG
ncbi:hypothetical protein [Streptomyces sp. AA1529]|uniref:hypothetical protein n=1 Tax=Streptomyces sp. AA1529 TaxID=1203257 RepID=UPI003D7600C4